MTARKNRNPTWLLCILLAAGALVLGGLGMWQYLRAVPPLHPDPQQVPSVTETRPSPAWVAAAERARQLARAEISEQNLPALSVAVGVAGQIVWAEGFGWANIEQRVPVTRGLRFRIGHTSKTLTSAAVGLLREQGRLHLDDEIQTYVPGYPRKAWPVTLRQLMGHVGGVRHYLGEEADVPTGHCERASDGVANVAGDPLLFQPGTQYRYSTYGWVLVSAAVEAAAREPFFTFMRTHIFAPLDMTDTRFDGANESAAGRATMYFPRFSGDNSFGHEVARAADYSCFAGAGAVLSTPSDLVRFGIAMNSGTLLQPDTVRLLQTPQALASGQATAYGLGWMLETMALAGAETREAGHASRSLLGASTSFMTFPERGIVVAVTSNTSYANTRSIAIGMAQAFAGVAQGAR